MTLMGAVPNSNVCLTIFPHFERDQPLLVFLVALTFETILIWIKQYLFLNLETISDQEIYNFIVLDTRGKKDALRGHARYSGHNRSNLGGPYSAGGSVSNENL